MRALRLAGGMALLAVGAAGCLVETGAKCADDTNCPPGQVCAAGACEPGSGSGAADGGGTDAGAAAPIAGLVTFNGGVAKPAGNDAWVLAWDHQPSDLDGGLEAAQISSATSADGTFALGAANRGTAYYLAVQYDLDGDGDPGVPGDWYGLFFSPVTAGAAGSSTTALDVQTSKCVVWSDYEASGGTAAYDTYLFALVADIRDITNGGELPAAQLQAAKVTDPNNGPPTFLSPLTGTGDSTLDGKYGWIPASGAVPPEAYDGTYQFAVTGTGYAHGSCQVRHHPLTQGPSNLVVPGTWQAVQNTVTWSSAPGTEQDTVTFYVINQSGTPPETETWTASPVTSPLSVPGYACPSPALCRFVVSSIHFDEQVRSVSIASASANVVFKVP